MLAGSSSLLPCSKLNYETDFFQVTGRQHRFCVLVTDVTTDDRYVIQDFTYWYINNSYDGETTVLIIIFPCTPWGSRSSQTRIVSSKYVRYSSCLATMTSLATPTPSPWLWEGLSATSKQVGSLVVVYCDGTGVILIAVRTLLAVSHVVPPFREGLPIVIV